MVNPFASSPRTTKTLSSGPSVKNAPRNPNGTRRATGNAPAPLIQRPGCRSCGGRK